VAHGSTRTAATVAAGRFALLSDMLAAGSTCLLGCFRLLAVLSEEPPMPPWRLMRQPCRHVPCCRLRWCFTAGQWRKECS
jgi:hypothetical protein